MSSEVLSQKCVYHPPSADVIEAYVRDICQQFDQASEGFNQAAVIWGFTEFVTIMSDIKVRVLNEAAEIQPESPIG